MDSDFIGPVNIGSDEMVSINLLAEVAMDIAGKNIANPIATILSFSMMLFYSFDNQSLSQIIDNSVKTVLDKGFRTEDIMDEKSQKVDTKQMGDLIIEEIIKNI